MAEASFSAYVLGKILLQIGKRTCFNHKSTTNFGRVFSFPFPFLSPRWPKQLYLFLKKAKTRRQKTRPPPRLYTGLHPGCIFAHTGVHRALRAGSPKDLDALRWTKIWDVSYRIVHSCLSRTLLWAYGFPSALTAGKDLDVRKLDAFLFSQFSETGRIRFRRVRFQTPVSFFALTEFRGENSVSSSQPIICVQKWTHRVFRRTHRVCPKTQWGSVSCLLRNSTLETVSRPFPKFCCHCFAQQFLQAELP